MMNDRPSPFDCSRPAATPPSPEEVRVALAAISWTGNKSSTPAEGTEEQEPEKAAHSHAGAPQPLAPPVPQSQFPSPVQRPF